MKQKDILTLALVMIIAAFFGVFLSKAIFKNAGNRNLTTPNVTAINETLLPADRRYFNDQSLNFTQVITITDTNNPNPFSE
jgi:hypothetical protein